jgi:hypothetical protein
MLVVHGQADISGGAGVGGAVCQCFGTLGQILGWWPEGSYEELSVRVLTGRELV